MIATLSGLIAEKLPELTVLDVNGVGYGLLMTTEDQGAVQSGQPIKLYVYEHIREQAHDLFGFRSLETKRFFELLMDVNGVGPKMALSLLSVGSLTQLKQAIAGGDVKYISQANGVGKRVAERVVVDLKDKVGLGSSELATSFLQSPAFGAQDEAMLALVALGYSVQDAARALEKVDPSFSTEERIKRALKG